jgi:hypothetical protein
LPLLNHPYALNATIIRFIVDCAISQEEMTALSQITLSTDSPYTSTLPIHQETSEIPNVFLQNLSAWLYIAGLPKDDPLKSAMLYKNKTPGSSIIDTMAQSMDATPDFQSIAYFCSTISAFTSCQASFLGFLKALNLEYPDKFNRCFK